MSATQKLSISKLTIAALCSAAALWFPLRILDNGECILFIRNKGYWLIFLCCGLFFWKFYRHFRKVKWAQLCGYLRCHWFGLILAGVVAGTLLFRDATGFKILFDEHVLSATARSMHITQVAYVQAAAHVVDHQYIALTGFTDKRPLLFPFLLSTLHNIAGYKVANVFALNAALTFALLALLYGLIARLCSRSYGVLGILLMGGLPLLAQNANGGGFEILNLCLIAGLLLSVAHYFRQDHPTEGLDLMILLSVLLANVRYESLLYAVIPVAAVLLKSLRNGKPEFTWFSAFSPLLLILPIAGYRVFRNEPKFFQTSEDNFLSIQHWPNNFYDAATYLFDWQGDFSNSILISALGIAAIIAFFIYYGLRPVQLLKQDESCLVFLPTLLVILGNTLLALSSFWGDWTDPATSRFSLPLQLAIVICTALVFHRILKQPTAPRWLLVLSAGYFIIVSPAHCLRMRHEFRMNTGPGYNWAMDWIRNEAPGGNHLYIAGSATGIGLLGVGAIPLVGANAMPERVALIQELGLYDEVYFIEELKHRGDSKPTALAHLTPLSERFETEPVARHYLSPVRFYQISRLVKLLPPQPEQETLPGHLPPPRPEGEMTPLQLQAYYESVLPLLPLNQHLEGNQ